MLGFFLGVCQVRVDDVGEGAERLAPLIDRVPPATAARAVSFGVEVDSNLLCLAVCLGGALSFDDYDDRGVDEAASAVVLAEDVERHRLAHLVSGIIG